MVPCISRRALWTWVSSQVTQDEYLPSLPDDVLEKHFGAPAGRQVQGIQQASSLHPWGWHSSGREVTMNTETNPCGQQGRVVTGTTKRSGGGAEGTARAGWRLLAPAAGCYRDPGCGARALRRHSICYLFLLGRSNRNGFRTHRIGHVRPREGSRRLG